MAADAWSIMDTFPERMGDNTIDMDADTFKLALFLSTSNLSVSVGTNLFGDLTNPLATTNGYTAGGYALSSVTWSTSSGVVKFDAADFAPLYTPSGGADSFRFGVIYDDTPTSPADPLVCMTTWDNTPADISVSDGSDFNVTFDASNGIFTSS